MPIRLYFDGELKADQSIQLDAGEMRYFKTVHRAKGVVTVFNREGFEAEGRFEGKDFFIEKVKKVSSPLYSLTVALGIPENSILAVVIRSLSELGVKKIIFFGANRSQSASKRLQPSDRLDKIALESARQCGRAFPLEIGFAKNLSEVLVNEKANSLLIFDEAENSDHKNPQKLESPCLALIGPEGGWSQEERELAQRNSAKIVHHNVPILRVETAVAVSSFYCIERL